jgi:formylglycine-generating enzyme required for sulfatase activity
MIRCLIIFLTLYFCLTAKEPIRTWTSTDGRTLEARYLKMVGSKVRIKNASGRTFIVPLTGFSSADQEYVKKAYGRSLFAVPQPFDNDGRGGVIVASAKGRVEVLVPPRDSYSKNKPKSRAVIVGESIASGATLTTGSGASVDLLLTNGTLAHLGESTKLVLSALYQKSFKGTNQKASELTNEVSPSRTALKLEEGDLVLEVRKLSKESSFLISTKMAQAGIRGTQFKVSANAYSAELSVLEGQVDFLDSEQLATAVETAQKTGARKGVPAKLKGMSASEQAEVKQAVEQAKGASASIDLNRLANTVDGYELKPNYIVKSALDMELIWCPPGAFIMGPGIWTPDGGEEWASPDENLPSHPVILTRGFYLGKFEVTQKEYEKVMGVNPSNFEGDKLPVEMVNWNEAMAFCAALNKKETITRGWRFTLPTETQWEYACRAGSTTNYSWGNDHDVSKANNRAGLKTVNVGSYPPNSWGFYDLHGNVWEWTFDLRDSYEKETAYDPVGEDQLLTRVARGGSAWGKKVSAFSVAKRRANLIDRYKYRGFRVALVQTD